VPDLFAFLHSMTLALAGCFIPVSGGTGTLVVRHLLCILGPGGEKKFIKISKKCVNYSYYI